MEAVEEIPPAMKIVIITQNEPFLIFALWLRKMSPKGKEIPAIVLLKPPSDIYNPSYLRKMLSSFGLGGSLKHAFLFPQEKPPNLLLNSFFSLTYSHSVRPFGVKNFVLVYKVKNISTLDCLEILRGECYG